ncbi:MAG: xanthine permease [Anaerolineales bacterium]|nr:xanthine permease [Anaerolineales bacterium]
MATKKKTSKAKPGKAKASLARPTQIVKGENAMAKNNIMGYMPNDTPPMGQTILLGFQHVLTMFPATVFVAAFCGFHVGTVLLASGVSTIVALILSRRSIGTFIPLFYGSSFSYIAAYQGISAAATGSPYVPFSGPLPNDVISLMQAGIVVTGLINIAVGFLIRAMGKASVDRFLPPVVTGSVAAIIGFGLAKAAVVDLASNNFLVAFITLILTILFSVYLQNRGFIGMLPVLLGGIAGYIASMLFAPGSVNFQPVLEANLIQMPNITLPSFGGELLITAIVSISIMAIATIPESTAHLYQMSLYIDRFAGETGREKLNLDKNVGYNLVFDGIGDFLNGLLGATAGTNYGENNSLMAITRNYSGPALISAGVISIILAFNGNLAALVNSIPLAVSGGLAIYLFGVIGMQGIALMQEHNVSMFNPRNLAIGAVIMVVGIGGNIAYPNGLLPLVIPGIFPSGLPAIATAAVLGILLNAVFLIFKPPLEEMEMGERAMASADD